MKGEQFVYLCDNNRNCIVQLSCIDNRNCIVQFSCIGQVIRDVITAHDGLTVPLCVCCVDDRPTASLVKALQSMCEALDSVVVVFNDIDDEIVRLTTEIRSSWAEAESEIERRAEEAIRRFTTSVNAEKDRMK